MFIFTPNLTCEEAGAPRGSSPWGRGEHVDSTHILSYCYWTTTAHIITLIKVAAFPVVPPECQGPFLSVCLHCHKIINAFSTNQTNTRTFTVIFILSCKCFQPPGLKVRISQQVKRNQHQPQRAREIKHLFVWKPLPRLCHTKLTSCLPSRWVLEFFQTTNTFTTKPEAEGKLGIPTVISSTERFHHHQV